MIPNHIIDRLIIMLREKQILDDGESAELLALQSPPGPPRPMEIRLIELLRENSTLTETDAQELYAHP